MQLRIRGRHIEMTEEAREAIERKVRLALGRHSADIDRADVTVSPSEARGSTRRCSIRVRLRQGDRLAIEDHAEDTPSAAAAAIWRLEHRLDRERFTRSMRAPKRGRGFR